MYDAIPLITILVAGADGKIDEQELAWAEKITKIRSFDYHSHLIPYYKQVGSRFSERLAHFSAELPEGVEARQAAISDKLSELNAIMPKIDENKAIIYYHSFVSFADHVAHSSGGFLRFMSVSASEAKVKDLPMLDKPAS